MSYSGMGMIFTNSGQRRSIQAQRQAPVQSPIQAQAPMPAPMPAPRQTRAFPQVMSGGALFRSMDLGSLKSGKSCGSCGH
jgi:hypothetical protein